MNAEILQQGNRQIRTITVIGMGINLGLAALKSVIGILAGSIGLLADGIHSLSDLVTDVAVLLGAHFGSRRPDSDHPYGHGRMETFATVFVALVLAVVGGGMIYKAAMEILRMHTQADQPVTKPIPVIWVALISVVLKEILYQFTRITAVKYHSTALYANAWHHRSDAFSSVAVLIGAVAVWMGYPHGDQLAAIAVGLLIILVSVRIIGDCLNEFAERAVDARTIEQIQRILESDHRVRQWHRLRTRTAGREIFLDVHILVDPQLQITEAHDVSEALERALHEQMTQPVNVMIHIEPDLPPLRKSGPETAGT